MVEGKEGGHQPSDEDLQKAEEHMTGDRDVEKISAMSKVREDTTEHFRNQEIKEISWIAEHTKWAKGLEDYNNDEVNRSLYLGLLREYGKDFSDLLNGIIIVEGDYDSVNGKHLDGCVSENEGRKQMFYLSLEGRPMVIYPMHDKDYARFIDRGSLK